ncbi:hypothetical protein JW824_03820 [bacterium]|nr:hypothetical protein [bacterium]RQV97438.1 MAG: hypothetical protein EH221_03805 [bacterium]
MAFQKQEERKGLSLPGLIDIVFLLLIFSLVTFSVSSVNVGSDEGRARAVDYQLPEARIRETLEMEEVLQTLLILVEYQNTEDVNGPRIVYTLWPSVKDSLTFSEAKNNAIRDSSFAQFPSNFLELSDYAFTNSSACLLIERAIRDYKNLFFYEPRNTNSVELRAVKETEFRIVNFIMEQCSSYGDTIPRILLHTLSDKGVENAF